MCVFFTVVSGGRVKLPIISYLALSFLFNILGGANPSETDDDTGVDEDLLAGVKDVAKVGAQMAADSVGLMSNATIAITRKFEEWLDKLR